MGYLRGPQKQAIKGTIPLTIAEKEDLNGSSKHDKYDAKLEFRHSSSLQIDYLSKNISLLDASEYVARRRMFEVNGDPLAHWNKDFFIPKRDAKYRVVYEPKMGRKFFHNALKQEDYAITRGLSTSLEQPYLSMYNRFHPKKGHFCCKACGNPLYSSKAKFDVDDGWPAFGACVLGSIGVTPVEERVAEIEEKEKACIKIQSFVRAHQCRRRVVKMLDEMIEELLRKKYEGAIEWIMCCEETDRDTSYKSISEFSWTSSSDETETDRSTSYKSNDTEFVLSRDLGDDYAEIHCHRCKSHLGDLFSQENTGNSGEIYRERHRVNGRALKYMDEDLPERTMEDASLLFADASQRRKFGLSRYKKEDEASCTKIQAFVRGHQCRQRVIRMLDEMIAELLRKKHGCAGKEEEGSDDCSSTGLLSSEFSWTSRSEETEEDDFFQLSETLQGRRFGPSPPFGVLHCTQDKKLDRLSVSNHDISKRDLRRKDSLPLSVSCHARSQNGSPKYEKKATLTTSPKQIGTNNSGRPMRRGSTETSISVADRAVWLENMLTHYAPY